MTQNPAAADTPYLIVGLGNPGSKFATTRHNVGFMVVDEVARRHGLRFSAKQANAEVARGEIAGTKVILAKPQTFMNLSGHAVQGLARYYKIPTDCILIIYDEIALPVGTIRIREKGSSAGHNGVNSVIQQMGTQNIARIRVGVDRPADPRHRQVDWVLGHFTKEERPVIEEAINRAAEAVERVFRIGIERTMNIYNTPAAGETKGPELAKEGRRTKEDRLPSATLPNPQPPALSSQPLEALPHTAKNDLSMDTLRRRIERIMQRKEQSK
jgi:PTH1 family peptidyl-tRNA hydrolase